MSKERWFSLALFLLTIAFGIFQMTVNRIPPLIGWTVCGIFLFVTWVFMVKAFRQKNSNKESHADANTAEKWAHFGTLTELILSFQNTPSDKWTSIVSNVQKELNFIKDRQISQMGKQVVDVVIECQEVGLNFDATVTNEVLVRMRDLMIKKYKLC